MNFVPDLLSLATTLLVLGLIVASVMKLFQIANDMQEMKEILKDFRRGGLPVSANPPIPAPVAYDSASPYASSSVAALAEAVPPAPPLPPPAPLNAPGMGFSQPPTPEELVRAVHAQDFRGDDFPL